MVTDTIGAAALLLTLAVLAAPRIRRAWHRHRASKCASCGKHLIARTPEQLMNIITALAAYDTPYCAPHAEAILSLDAEIEEHL